MKTFKGRTAVITGAGSGFGLETSRIAAREGMNVVMADVQADALDKAAAEVAAGGAKVLPWRLDVSKAAEVEALGAAVQERFGAPHFVFNNAGVGSGGLIWENSVKDWGRRTGFLIRVHPCPSVVDLLSAQPLRRMVRLATAKLASATQAQPKKSPWRL